MARPVLLQMLQRGKLLCGKLFPGFAETFNYTVNRCENLKGDRDTDPQSGHVTVDNTDPEHPVIRLAKLPAGGGAGEGASGTVTVVTSVAYDTSTHRLTMKLRPLTVKNGVIASIGEESEATITTAVEETV